MNRFLCSLVVLLVAMPAWADRMYIDRLNHFRIELPSGWEIKQPQGMTTVLKVVDGSGGNLNVSMQPVDAGITDDAVSHEWVDLILVSIKSRFSDAEMIQGGLSYLNNHRAAYGVLSYTVRNLGIAAPSVMMVYQTIADENIVSVTCGGHRDEYLHYKPICEKSLCSIVFEGFAY